MRWHILQHFCGISVAFLCVCRDTQDVFKMQGGSVKLHDQPGLHMPPHASLVYYSDYSVAYLTILYGMSATGLKNFYICCCRLLQRLLLPRIFT